jgi:hypothetical protein
MAQWKDKDQKDAPAAVRRMHDRLLAAITADEEASLDAGLSVKKSNCDVCPLLNRGMHCLCTCGMSECWFLCKFPSDEPKDYHKDSAFPASGSYQSIYDRRRAELEQAVANLKEAVNDSVASPEHYEGDANIFALGPYVFSGRWSRTGGDFCQGPKAYKYYSVKRDASSIIPSIVAFADTHGGWDAKAVQHARSSTPQADTRPVIIVVSRDAPIPTEAAHLLAGYQEMV